MKATRLKPFGVELSSIDLGTEVTVDLVEKVKRLLHSESVVVFRDQNLDDAGQLAFARRFGKFSKVNPPDIESHVYRVNNRDGFGSASEVMFHADNMFTPFPVKYLMLYGLDVTTNGLALEGGETMFASTVTALDRLPLHIVKELERLECLMTVPGLEGYQTKPVCVHPCIRMHPVTGQRYLVISECMTQEIVGVDSVVGAELINEVCETLYDESHLLYHRWSEGDMVMWDNCLLQHGRSYYDNAQTRILRRCAIADNNEPTAVTA
jgi:alpha-ketoglutarate-dependent taurine dioxygenase